MSEIFLAVEIQSTDQTVLNLFKKVVWHLFKKQLQAKSFSVFTLTFLVP